MAEYVFNPMSPLPKMWSDYRGPIRVMTPKPIEGWVMVRRPSSAPFTLMVKELLSEYKPVFPKPKINVRKSIQELRDID